MNFIWLSKRDACTVILWAMRIGLIPLLIGLGVSSISDAWGGFAQNVKTV
jgi:hypothetical protein